MPKTRNQFIIKAEARRLGHPPSEILEQSLLKQLFHETMVDVKDLQTRISALECGAPLPDSPQRIQPWRAAERKDVQQWTVRLSKALIDHLKAVAYERRIAPSQLLEELVWHALHDR